MRKDDAGGRKRGGKRKPLRIRLGPKTGETGGRDGHNIDRSECRAFDSVVVVNDADCLDEVIL